MWRDECLLGLLRGWPRLPIPNPRKRNMWGLIWGDLRQLDGTELLTSTDLFDWIDFMSGLSTFCLVWSECSISPREETLNLGTLFSRCCMSLSNNLDPFLQLRLGSLRHDWRIVKNLHFEDEGFLAMVRRRKIRPSLTSPSFISSIIPRSMAWRTLPHVSFGRNTSIQSLNDTLHPADPSLGLRLTQKTRSLIRGNTHNWLTEPF